MKKVLGCIRRACDDFRLIDPGDRIAVGVSGGKDSTLLLHAIRLYRYFSPVPFTFCAIHLQMGFEDMDAAPLADYARQSGIDLHIVPTDIAAVVFDVRKEKNPCSLCAKMRRGALNNYAKQLGCNKVALAHHMDDALETFFLSLFYEARIYTLSPRSYLDRTDLTLIRPMLYLPEKHINNTVRRLSLPVIHNPCPANGRTKRQDMKEFISSIAAQIPGAKEKMLHALQNTGAYSLWDKAKT
ncbi:MAG: tRNA lysidine(34) synthetase [Bacillota bacterium]